jgi:hypothetical protein
MEHPATALAELQAALDHMRTALASGDLVRLLAAQERCAASVPSIAADLAADLRPELRASLARARATLTACQSINGELLGIVERCRSQAEGPFDYTRSGGAAAPSVAGGHEASVSCRA